MSASSRRAGGNVYVFTGPLYTTRDPRTIGQGRVWVPDQLFKLVYDETSGRSWAYIVGNDAQSRLGPPMSYQEFVQRTGLPLLSSVHSAARMARSS